MTMFVYGMICGAIMCGITYLIIDWRDSRRFDRSMRAVLREMEQMEQQNDIRLTKVSSEHVRTSHHD